MRIAIGIPTFGRAAVLAKTVADLARQTRRPDRIVVCHARAEDVPAGPARASGIEYVSTEPGLPRQRNRIIAQVRDCDLLLFLDDDFLLRNDYVAVMERLFALRPGLVVATGTVLADGATGRGLGFAEARALLEAAPPCADPLATTPVANGYGCNMAIRLATLRRTGLRFDERMPLYAWQEDAELSCRLAPHGEILRVAGARGVHLGVKGGRTAGLQLGYSQVINPFYIARGVPAYGLRRAALQVGRNLAANLLRALRPEPWIDRRGRLRGNMLGLADLVRGRLTPERVLALGPPGGGRGARRMIGTMASGLGATHRGESRQ
jgi:GT2 family glycosyltransferase